MRHRLLWTQWRYQKPTCCNARLKDARTLIITPASFYKVLIQKQAPLYTDSCPPVCLSVSHTIPGEYDNCFRLAPIPTKHVPFTPSLLWIFRIAFGCNPISLILYEYLNLCMRSFLGLWMIYYNCFHTACPMNWVIYFKRRWNAINDSIMDSRKSNKDSRAKSCARQPWAVSY